MCVVRKVFGSYFRMCDLRVAGCEENKKIPNAEIVYEMKLGEAVSEEEAFLSRLREGGRGRGRFSFFFSVYSEPKCQDASDEEFAG